MCACYLVHRESEQILKKSGMKRVLLLGSGYVSHPVVEYLTRDPGTQVTVGKCHGPQLRNLTRLILKAVIPCSLFWVSASKPKFLLWLFSASVLLSQAEELAAKYPNTIPVMLDVTSQESHLESLVKDHNLVIRHGFYDKPLNLFYTITFTNTQLTWPGFPLPPSFF